MFDWEDEFIIESYRVPWLIWVQFLVMILLVIVVVFGFGIFALDLSGNPNCGSASSSSLSSSRSSGKKPPFRATSCSDSSKLQGWEKTNLHMEKEDVGAAGNFSLVSLLENMKIEGNETNQKKTDPGTSKGIIEEESIEIDESSAKDIALYRLFGPADHPCNYLDLAKQAFLKCLGLGYSSESSHKKKHGKRD